MRRDIGQGGQVRAVQASAVPAALKQLLRDLKYGTVLDSMAGRSVGYDDAALAGIVAAVTSVDQKPGPAAHVARVRI
jgi:hypothetical protein